MIRAVRAATLVAAALCLALVSVPAAASAPTGVEDFAFESMHVGYELGRAEDGTATLRATETLVALFPDYDQNRGIIRSIPTSYQRVDLELRVLGVSDERGRAVPFTTETWRDYDGTAFIDVVVGTDDYVHGRTTYVIEWSARHVIRAFADTRADEFYWDVNGTGWAQSFGSVSADVRIAPELRDALTGRTACYWGYEGSGTPCEVAEGDDGFHVDVTPIAAYQNVTVAIGFESGTFVPGVPIDRHGMVTVVPWVLLGTLGAITLLVIALRTLLWRHAPGRGIVVPEYEPPDGIGVMLAAELLGRAPAGLPAQIVALAVNGVVRLVEDPDEPSTRRFRLELVDLAAATGSDDDLALRKLFGAKAKDGATLVLDRADRRLGDRVASLTSRVSSELRSRKYLERGRSPLRRLIFWPALACFVAAWVIVVWCGINDVGSGWLTFGIVLTLLWSLVLLGFSGKPERRTGKGTAVYERLLGLRDYIRLAEADRIRMLQTPQGAERRRIDATDPAAIVRLYEELLPWAMVWGLEREWAEVLGSRYAESAPPSSNLSFATSGIATIASLGGSLAASGFARTPTASSSSSGSGGSSGFSGGSSGGGFSGGGGGGGGGGGR